jgi:hypothetical protein
MSERDSRSPYEDFDHLSLVQRDLLKSGCHFFPVEREHVEGLVTDPLLTRLRRTIKHRGFRNVAARTAISFSGYAYDPREIFAIPEIRSYYAKLDEQLPELPALLTVLPVMRYNGPAIHVELLGTVSEVVQRPELDGYDLRVAEAPVIIAAAKRRIEAAGCKYHVPPAEARRLAEQFEYWAQLPLLPPERPPMAGGAPMKTYKGFSEDHGSAMGPRAVFVETDDGQFAPLKHEVHHSPDGFSWGFPGSGPADLARSLLADHLGFVPHPAIYQAFKRQYVAHWEEGKPWSITSEQVETFLAQPKMQELLEAQQQDEALRREIAELERAEAACSSGDPHVSEEQQD